MSVLFLKSIKKKYKGVDFQHLFFYNKIKLERQIFQMKRKDIFCPLKATEIPEGSYVLLRTFRPSFRPGILNKNELNLSVAKIHNNIAYSACINENEFRCIRFFRTCKSICCIIPESEILEDERNLIQSNISDRKFNSPSLYSLELYEKIVKYRFNRKASILCFTVEKISDKEISAKKSIITKNIKSYSDLYNEYVNSNELSSIDDLDE